MIGGKRQPRPKPSLINDIFWGGLLPKDLQNLRVEDVEYSPNGTIKQIELKRGKTHWFLHISLMECMSEPRKQPSGNYKRTPEDCQYCGGKIGSRSGIICHERACKSNPNIPVCKICGWEIEKKVGGKYTNEKEPEPLGWTAEELRKFSWGRLTGWLLTKDGKRVRDLHNKVLCEHQYGTEEEK